MIYRKSLTLLRAMIGPDGNFLRGDAYEIPADYGYRVYDGKQWIPVAASWICEHTKANAGFEVDWLDVLAKVEEEQHDLDYPQQEGRTMTFDELTKRARKLAHPKRGYALEADGYWLVYDGAKFVNISAETLKHDWPTAKLPKTWTEKDWDIVLERAGFPAPDSRPTADEQGQAKHPAHGPVEFRWADGHNDTMTLPSPLPPNYTRVVAIPRNTAAAYGGNSPIFASEHGLVGTVTFDLVRKKGSGILPGYEFYRERTATFPGSCETGKTAAGLEEASKEYTKAHQEVLDRLFPKVVIHGDLTPKPPEPDLVRVWWWPEPLEAEEVRRILTYDRPLLKYTCGSQENGPPEEVFGKVFDRRWKSRSNRYTIAAAVLARTGKTPAELEAEQQAIFDWAEEDGWERGSK
jgi:hypothetical protein